MEINLRISLAESLWRWTISLVTAIEQSWPNTVNLMFASPIGYHCSAKCPAAPDTFALPDALALPVQHKEAKTPANANEHQCDKMIPSMDIYVFIKLLVFINLYLNGGHCDSHVFAWGASYSRPEHDDAPGRSA